ncbi:MULTISPECIES: MFS transporter [Ramlibacter]|uniref:MFS transporter n=1 Tax=Ramlibacter aquaticus TaxID=2780094 RepID=A0ABR9SC32_9BURK|nr:MULTISPECIES: MFS transporter [Ramlibacter]MBE7939900.1 MFS transporter [Ramlibacter aquaticus]
MTANTLASPAHAPEARRGAAAARPASGAARVPARVVAATVAGNALEFYDFVTYAFFAVYIGRTFFPASTPMGSLLLSVAVFGVGFFARPVGGVLIGAFADRAGRRPALLLTIALITIGTLGLALTPSYESIGLAAPLIVVACRLVQGLALGGEVGPSTAFLIEAAPQGRRGFYASWQLASQGAASLVAGLVGLALTLSLTPAEMQAWGWRVPFAVGLLLVPVAMVLRNSMPETLHEAPRVAANSGIVGLKRRRGVIGLAVLLVIGGTVSTYLGTYMTTFAITALKLSPALAMGATVAVGLSTLVFSVLGGWMADRWGRRGTMLWPRVAAAVLTVPAFMLLVAQPGATTLIAVSAFLAALTAISGTASIVAIPELLPRGIRATGMSIAYAIGVSIFGGSTQFVVTWLMGATGNPASPAWYVAAASVVTAIAMLAVPETRDQALED